MLGKGAIGDGLLGMGVRDPGELAGAKIGAGFDLAFRVGDGGKSLSNPYP